MAEGKKCTGRRFFVALLNEKMGPPPLPTYGEFVQARTHSIERHLHHVRTVSINISREGRRRNAPPTATPPPLPTEPNKRAGAQKTGETKRTRRSRAALSARPGGPGTDADVETDETADDETPLLDEPLQTAPMPAAPPSSARSVATAAASVGRAERTTEKTQLVVCENPLALLDSINGVGDQIGRRETGMRLHTYMACVAGPFSQHDRAVRYCKKWGEGSRGSGPRASWGDSLFHIQGVQFFVDPEVIFSAHGPAPPMPEEHAQSEGSSAGAAADDAPSVPNDT